MLRTLALTFVLFQITPSHRVQSHSPAQFFEVLDGKAGSQVEHGVEVQTALDAGRAEVDLVGPKLFARGVAAMGRTGNSPKAFLNWYEIESPQPAAKPLVSILDPFRGDKMTALKLTTADYLLCPSQVIATGAPAPIPHGLDFYKAYRVVDADSVKAKVTIGSGDKKKERVVGKPIYVCIASKHWHHEEHTDATHPDQCYVVYELDEVEVDEKISVMDQFGLNQFQSKSNKWLCVTGKLLELE